jgi:tetratricopeptide (TPR) repeat protein
MTITERWLYEGRRLHDAGELGKAAGYYRRVLKREPNNVDALFFMGSLKIALGEYNNAIDILKVVVACRPTWPEAHNNLGSAYLFSLNCVKSLEHYDIACDLRPDFQEALNNRAGCLARVNSLEAAMDNVDKSLAIAPNDANSLINQAIIFRSMKKRDKAAEAALRALDNAPAGDAVILKNIADILYSLEEYPKSAEVYERVTQLVPSDSESYNRQASALNKIDDNGVKQAKLEKILALIDKSLQYDPRNISAINNKAGLLQQLTRYAEAEECLMQIKELIYTRPDLSNNYGAILMMTSRFDEAIECFKRSIELDPYQPLPYYNWGGVCHMTSRLDEAEEKFRKSLSLKPDCPLTLTGIGMLHLARGDFKNGWAEYESRKYIDQFTGRVFRTPQWIDSNLNGKQIVLHAEQGLGDTFHFIRYAELVKARGGEVIVECHDGLKNLIKSCPGIDIVYEREEVVNDEVTVRYNEQANLGSLPYIFGTDLDTIPCKVPYLSPSEESLKIWTNRINELTPPDTRLKIGIVWAGNPSHRNDKVRSTTLAQFGALADIQGVTFFSLQKGPSEDQLASPPENMVLIPLGQDLESFEDTASVIMNLDLVISVDTSIVHLAGALAAPVWMVLPSNPDFRWLLERIDSPWYPTLRIFRQTERGNYNPVFAAVKEELVKFSNDAAGWIISDARRKYEAGDREHAILQLMAAAKRYPSDARMYNALSEALWHNGSTKEALSMCVAALQIDPFDRSTVKNSAYILSEFGQRDEAKMVYCNYLNRNPNDFEIKEAIDNLIGEKLLAAA